SLPEDHMADFHHLDDAREIWLAVKARFGGNEESKKMRKTMPEAKNKTEEGEQVYGLMAGIKSKSHLIKDFNVYDNVDNFPSVVSKAASVPAGSRNSSAFISVSRSIPAASRNRPGSHFFLLEDGVLLLSPQQVHPHVIEGKNKTKGRLTVVY
nr:ribonuclease H-like domain-containing protein [Tanacetum cinerariifolium]